MFKIEWKNMQGDFMFTQQEILNLYVELCFGGFVKRFCESLSYFPILFKRRKKKRMKIKGFDTHIQKMFVKAKVSRKHICMFK